MTSEEAIINKLTGKERGAKARAVITAAVTLNRYNAEGYGLFGPIDYSYVVGAFKNLASALKIDDYYRSANSKVVHPVRPSSVEKLNLIAASLVEKGTYNGEFSVIGLAKIIEFKEQIVAAQKLIDSKVSEQDARETPKSS